MTATYDIHVQPVVASNTKCFGFAYQTALKVRGPQALVNRWIRTLLTPLGSDPLYPKAGTPLGHVFSVSSNITTVDIQDTVHMSVFDANAQVQEQDIQGSYAEDECLASAVVTRMVNTADGLEVWIRIDTVSGDTVQFNAVTLR